MRRPSTVVLSLSLLWVFGLVTGAGCVTSPGPDAGSSPDAGLTGTDAGTRDAGGPDAGQPDGGETDAGGADAGEVGWDAGAYDGGVVLRLGMVRPAPVENAGAAVGVLGWVTLEGVQTQVGPVAGLFVEAGYGPRGSNAITGSWSWFPAPFGGSIFDLATYDRWLTLPVGAWDVAMRFSLGPTVIYVDTDQATPYSPAENGHVEVVATAGDLDYCAAWSPDTLTLDAGTGTVVYGRVYEAGLTTSPSPVTSITSQVGQGPDGTDPRTAHGWIWHDAQANPNYCCFSSNDDEHLGRLWAPLQPGSRRFAWRFRLQGAWTYCDRDGSGTNPGLDFDPAKLGTITVR